MKDTPSAIEEKYREMMMSRSGEQRLKMGCAMFDSARDMALASLADYSDTQKKILLFERLYGQDFDAETRAKIAVSITKGCEC